MEIMIHEEESNKIKLELVGEDHTLANILCSELLEDKGVKIIGYTMERPTISNPLIVLESNSKDPKKSIFNAIERLKAKNKKLLDLTKSIK